MGHLLLLLTSLAAPSDEGDFVYVSVAGEKQIAVYRQSVTDGSLTPIERVTLTAEPGALAISPDKKLIVAAYRSSGELATLSRDPATGRLKWLHTIPAGDDPAQLSIDPTGKFVFTAYYRAAKVTVHEIGADGKLADPPRQSLPTADKAHAIMLTPDRKFVFVPHTGSEAIFQFRWDAVAGKLTANTPAKVTTKPGTGPRHLVFSANLPIAYFGNEQGGSVTAYKIAEDGTLSALQTVSSLPADFREKNATAEIRLHPSGRFLYIANRGHDRIARLALDSETGRMTHLGTTATEPTPRSFDISSDGRYLTAAGESSGKLALYRIDAKTGDLARIGTTPAGKMAWWVMCVAPPAAK